MGNWEAGVFEIVLISGTSLGRVTRILLTALPIKYDEIYNS